MTTTAAPRWHQYVFQPRRIFGALFVVSLLVYLALIPIPRVDGQLIGSDGVGYYVYVRSLIIDHDLDFTNEYAYFDQAMKHPGMTPLGMPANKYAIGPSLLWLPFFLVAHMLALVGNALGMPVQPDGYGFLYQAAISIGSIIYGMLGIILAYRCARTWFARVPTLLAVGLFWLASNSIYYMVFEPSMSHMVSLFSVSLVLSLWLWWFRGDTAPSLTHSLLLGISGGIVMLVRTQDSIFLLVPYLTILLRFLQTWRTDQQHAHADNRQQRWRWFTSGLVVGGSTLAMFSLQVFVWHHLYGTFTNPYLSDHDPAFTWLQPKVFNVLFSSFHGLFSWHPVLLLATLGLVVVARYDRRLVFGVAGVLVLNLYIISAWWAWWQGDSFGGRMFLNAGWVWIVGLAGLLHVVWQRPQWQPIVLGVSSLLIVWNGLSLVQYRLGFVPMSEPLTWQQMTLERLVLPWTLIQKLLT
jgi:hypothetical protein